jgi:hypothetical protein
VEKKNMESGQKATGEHWKDKIESSLQYYWGGTKELVERYFSKPRPIEKDLDWIRVTLYKEIHSVPRILPQVTDLYDKIDVEIDRHQYEDIAYELADEVKHYRLLADIFDWASGQKISPRECAPSPQQKKLEELRDKKASPLWKDLYLIPHLNVSHECVFASVMKDITGGELEKKIASAYEEIYRDEIHHYQLGWREIEAVNLTSEDLEKVIAAHLKIARQYLVMRNELFNLALPEERIQEIDRGKVIPYRPS